MKDKVAFYCGHAFALYDVLPLFKSYDSDVYEIYIITKTKYYSVVKEQFGLKDDNIFLIEDYSSRVGNHFTLWFNLLCVSIDFSDFYAARRKIKLTPLQQKIANAFKFLNLKNKNVNVIYGKIIRLFERLALIKGLPIDFNKIYVVTKVFHPYLLAKYEDKMHVIMESWDHPAKEPFLLNPASVESWNVALNDDLTKYQFYKNTLKGDGLKFRYIKEFNSFYDTAILNDEEREDIAFIENNEVAIYPMCTSSSYFAFAEEVKFVEDLALKLKREKITLYIRPYPLAPYADVVALQALGNVKVGIGNKIPDGLEVFSENHMLHKYLIIKHAKYVINLATTFVFDAALVDAQCKIIQLKIDRTTYGDLGRYSRGVHVTKYLHVQNTQGFVDFTLLNVDYTYKKYLNNWLNN
jgi:hypothetical protein